MDTQTNNLASVWGTHFDEGSVSAPRWIPFDRSRPSSSGHPGESPDGARACASCRVGSEVVS